MGSGNKLKMKDVRRHRGKRVKKKDKLIELVEARVATTMRNFSDLKIHPDGMINWSEKGHFMMQESAGTQTLVHASGVACRLPESLQGKPWKLEDNHQYSKACIRHQLVRITCVSVFSDANVVIQEAAETLKTVPEKSSPNKMSCGEGRQMHSSPPTASSASDPTPRASAAPQLSEAAAPPPPEADGETMLA